jgi:hypothetical protein
MYKCAFVLAMAGIMPAAAIFGGEVQAVLKQYCGKCHHDKRTGNKQYDVTKLESLLKTKPSPRVAKKYPDAKAYIVPKKPAESLTWLRIETGDMPPRNNPRPSEEDQAKIKKWIEDGAPESGF